MLHENKTPENHFRWLLVAAVLDVVELAAVVLAAAGPARKDLFSFFSLDLLPVHQPSLMTLVPTH